MPPKPRIHLIATGGTISAAAPDPADTRGYTVGALTAEALVASVPQLIDLAEISVEQLYNIDSKDMTPDHWLGLARATQAALARDDVDGVVITHGTDTMEESAFFLDLVLPPGKPVVFTGAMRPATALSADGPMNLFEAVGVATHSDFHDVGVVVVMHGEVHAARHVAKFCTGGGAAFVSPGLGPIGWAHPPRLCLIPKRIRIPAAHLEQLESLPRVDIIGVAAGSHPNLIAASVALGARGIVLELPGCGSVPDAWMAAIRDAEKSGTSILKWSRAGSISAESSALPEAWRGVSLSAAHARIVLQVTLATQS